MIKQRDKRLLLEIFLEDITIFPLSLYILPRPLGVQNVTSVKKYSYVSGYFQMARYLLIFIYCSLRRWIENKFNRHHHYHPCQPELNAYCVPDTIISSLTESSQPSELQSFSHLIDKETEAWRLKSLPRSCG